MLLYKNLSQKMESYFLGFIIYGILVQKFYEKPTGIGIGKPASLLLHFLFPISETPLKMYQKIKKVLRS